MQKLRHLCIGSLNVLSEYRYILLVAFVLFKVTIYATNGLWYGDFWEHSAVVSAFMADPVHPSHPLFALSAPHAFMSPYHWVVAAFAQATGLSAIEALALFGLLNFCLLAAGLRAYVGGFAGKQSNFTSFYALLCILFLWGPNPWGHSGFFHFAQLADVLPYSSTFATGVSLLALGLGFGNVRLSTATRLLGLTVAGAIVLLSHPLTFVFLASGLLCQCVQPGQVRFLVKSGEVVASLCVAVLVAALWPYYSILELLTGAGDIYHSSNLVMYVDALSRIWPVLLLSALLVPAIKRAETRTILLHIGLLILIYFFGYVSGKYSYGRDITFIVILAQILIGYSLANVESDLYQAQPAITRGLRTVLAVALFTSSLTWLVPTITRTLTVINSLVLGRQVSNQQMYKNLTFLPQFVKPGETVLSDLETSWLVPTFGGKVIAGLHAQAFLADNDLRVAELNEFFNPSTTDTGRQAFISKYKPAYLLLDKQNTPAWQALNQKFSQAPQGHTLFENEQFLLIRLDSKE